MIRTLLLGAIGLFVYALIAQAAMDWYQRRMLDESLGRPLRRRVP